MSAALPADSSEARAATLTGSARRREAMKPALVVFRSVFGGWGWEMIGEQGEFLAESRFEFESPEECTEDALKHAADRERSAAR